MIKKKKQKQLNKDRYLVTYSDLITLLLAFFILLYAMSDPNKEKVESLAAQLSITFSSSSEIITIDNTKEIPVRTYREIADDSEILMMRSISEQNSLRGLKREVDRKIRDFGLANEASTELVSDGLKIILTNDILFDTGSAELNNKKSIELIEDISKLLVNIKNPVSIEGHADNVPINNNKYSSNWELSADRALSVLKKMEEASPNIDITKFSFVGYGEYKPIESNSTEEGKQKNRRVEIFIKRMHNDGLLKVGSDN